MAPSSPNLAVVCRCGARRVIALAAMAKDRRVANLTLAHVALKIACEGCHNGPDDVHLTATSFGIGPGATVGGEMVWTLSLMERPGTGAKHLRRMPDSEVIDPPHGGRVRRHDIADAAQLYRHRI